jgi:hypothetical protein
MPASPAQPNDTLAVIAVLVIIVAGLCATHWRAVLPAIVAITAVLALTGAGVVIYGLVSLMASHHG